MLAKEVAQNYGNRVQFISENWGDSKLAARFGLKRYPAVFVNDVLLARPEDFGWFGEKARYSWKDPANPEKFKKDLARLVDLELRGDTQGAQAAGTASREAPDLARLPKLAMKDLQGNAIDTSTLDGKIVVVEFWATWCVPCRSTLTWLNEMHRLHPGKIEIIGIAVESSEADVRKLTDPMQLGYHLVMGSDPMALAFGDITSVPTMYIFDGSGKAASIVYGAPEDLHEKIGGTIDALLKK